MCLAAAAVAAAGDSRHFENYSWRWPWCRESLVSSLLTFSVIPLFSMQSGGTKL